MNATATLRLTLGKMSEATWEAYRAPARLLCDTLHSSQPLLVRLVPRKHNRGWQ